MLLMARNLTCLRKRRFVRGYELFTPCCVHLYSSSFHCILLLLFERVPPRAVGLTWNKLRTLFWCTCKLCFVVGHVLMRFFATY